LSFYFRVLVAVVAFIAAALVPCNEGFMGHYTKLY